MLMATHTPIRILTPTMDIRTVGFTSAGAGAAGVMATVDTTGDAVGTADIVAVDTLGVAVDTLGVVVDTLAVVVDTLAAAVGSTVVAATAADTGN
jgi:propanediol utilization protein